MSSHFFSFGVSICEYKAAVTHKYYMVWRCKAGINDWGVCMAGPSGIVLRQAGMLRVWSLSLCVSLPHNVDCVFFSACLHWDAGFIACVLTCLSVALCSLTRSTLNSYSATDGAAASPR